MAVYLIHRRTRDGGHRWHVRYQRSSLDRAVHLGSFKTRDLAEVLKRRVERMVAEGQPISRDALSPAAARRSVTLAEHAKLWLPTRVDIEDETRGTLASRLAHAVDAFGGRDSASITTSEVQAWVLSLPHAPGTVHKIVGALRQLLDYAGVEPNPCASRHLRLPKLPHRVLVLPTRDELEEIYARAPKHAPLLRLLEATGLRVGSAVALRRADFDEQRNRVFVADKTAAGRRWVQLGEIPDHLPVKRHYVRTLGELPAPLAFGRFFSGTRSGVWRAMSEACDRAGVAHFTPHDLRHLHATRLLADGWNPGDVAARLGHSSPAVTLRTYAHCVPPD